MPVILFDCFPSNRLLKYWLQLQKSSQTMLLFPLPTSKKALVACSTRSEIFAVRVLRGISAACQAHPTSAQQRGLSYRKRLIAAIEFAERPSPNPTWISRPLIGEVAMISSKTFSTAGHILTILPV